MVAVACFITTGCDDGVCVLIWFDILIACVPHLIEITSKCSAHILMCSAHVKHSYYIVYYTLLSSLPFSTPNSPASIQAMQQPYIDHIYWKSGIFSNFPLRNQMVNVFEKPV